jgi:hypothetical protein
VSVRKRGPRRWEVRWRDGDRHRSAQFSTRDEAKEFDEERRRRRRMGAFAPTDPSDQPLVEHAREWFDRERDGWAKSTRLNRAHLLDRWIIPYLGGERLKDVGQPRVRAWRAAIERDGAPTVSANRALGTLSAMLGAAVRDRKLPFNPCSGVDKRREVVSRPRVLTPLEVERIRAEMPSLRDATLVSLMAYAGLRPRRGVRVAVGGRGEPARPSTARSRMASSDRRRRAAGGWWTWWSRCGKTSSDFGWEPSEVRPLWWRRRGRGRRSTSARGGAASGGPPSRAPLESTVTL